MLARRRQHFADFDVLRSQGGLICRNTEMSGRRRRTFPNAFHIDLQIDPVHWWGDDPARRMAMSYLVVAPEFFASAASDLSNIGSSLTAAHAAASASTTAVVAAGTDEVSAAVASLFSGHGQAFQTLGAQAAAFHAEFVRTLSGAGGAYSLTEAANTSPLQTLWPLWQDVRAVIYTPTNLLWGRR
jgi:hypothetical protein